VWFAMPLIPNWKAVSFLSWPDQISKAMGSGGNCYSCLLATRKPRTFER
jgi:hypothetical protein